MKKNSVLNQIASIRQNPVAGAVGFILGGFVPSVVFTVAHWQVQQHQELWLLIIGGLLYSAKTVHQWGMMVWGDWYKATGFVILIEGSMTFAGGWVPIGGLILLGLINGVAAAHALVIGKPEAAVKTRKRSKARKTSKMPSAPQLQLVEQVS